MTARTGMAYLIIELRGLTETSVSDYTINNKSYWIDDDLQNILDVHRKDIIFEQLQMYPVQVAGGSLSYKDYRSSQGYFEETTGGTAVFYVQDSTGATIGTSTYTPNYRRGQVQFSSDQSGSVYYLTGSVYDLNAAAADVWRRKAAHLASVSFDFSTDNHSISRSQVYKHSLEMAEYFDSKSAESVTTVQSFRSDVC